MIGELEPAQIDRLLKSGIVGRIGCHADGRTYVVPITYVYDGQYIYGHSGVGQKVLMMRVNPNVCFEVDHLQNMANWESVIIQGVYEELQDEEAERALQLLLERIMLLVASETSLPSHSMEGRSKFHAGMTNGHTVVYRIKILEKTGRYEKR